MLCEIWLSLSKEIILLIIIIILSCWRLISYESKMHSDVSSRGIVGDVNAPVCPSTSLALFSGFIWKQ